MEYEVAITQTEKGLQSNANSILELVNSQEYKKYNYIVTTDNYDQAVKDKKILNNAIDKAKRTRIDFEKNILNEWNPIKETLVKAEKIVEGYKNALDAGVKTVDERVKEEKRKAIHSYYVENLNELQIPFDKVLDNKWLNKSCTQKQWQEGVKKKIADYELEYSLLERSDVEDKELLKSIFMDTWDRMESFVKYDAQMTARKRADELRKQQESKHQEEFEKPKEIKPQIADISDIEIDQDEIDCITPSVNEMVSIRGNKEAYEKARSYALSLGLTWEVL